MERLIPLDSMKPNLFFLLQRYLGLCWAWRRLSRRSWLIWTAVVVNLRRVVNRPVRVSTPGQRVDNPPQDAILPHN